MNKLYVRTLFLLLAAFIGVFTYKINKGIARIDHHLLQLSLLNKHIETEKLFKEHKNELTKNDPQSLLIHGQKYFSQNEEDGIIEEIFKRIGVTNKYFVEFGVHPFENNTLNLLLQDWNGMWIEGSAQTIKEIKCNLNQEMQNKLKLVNSFITKENISELFLNHKVPKNLDLLSVDIDGNDYWVCREILQSGFKPRVVVIEYNATFSPQVEYISPYEPNFSWDGSSCFGSSLKSIQEMMKQEGYELVGCNFTGVNAFFVRQDALNDKFSPNFSTSKHYRPALYNMLGFARRGHPHRKL